MEEFLADLKTVYLKHGMIIDACSCCDGTWVASKATPAHIHDAIEHLERQGDPLQLEGGE